MMTPFSIALDGPSGAGKSTIAKALATELGAVYLDTGAMYRAIGLFMLRKQININDPRKIADHVYDADIDVRYENGTQHIYLDGGDVSEAIRTPEASMAASKVSAVPEVRKRLVELQQKIAEGQNVVMDGRDIGTHVLPNATLKIYLTASVEVRAKRRQLELESKGQSEPYEKVLSEMMARDYADMNRAASPLRAAADAKRVDCSDLTLDEVVSLLEKMSRTAIGG